MAKDKSLYKELRAHGVRKGRAKEISSSLASRKGSDRPRTAKRAVEDLRAAASRIQDRMTLDEDRRAAAAKGAKTRKKKAKKRKQGARKLAAGRPG